VLPVENIYRMKYDVELVADLGAELLEGPVFDNANHFLYFVSILDYRVYRFNPLTVEMRYIQLTSPTSCVFISAEFGIVAASIQGFYILNFESLTAEKTFEIVIPSNTRFNDGTLDAKGRFLIGTMGYPEIIENIGSVLSYSNGNVKVLINNTTISNGIVLTKDSKNMFFIDTPTRTISKYKYDLESGSCDYINDLVHFQGAGAPDGMDMDEDGNLWVAEWGGYCVSIWNSRTGENMGRIEIPLENVTSVCFDNHKNLYVTTASSNAQGEVKGGAVFYVRIRKDA
jgi:sugar lactone lactonase YvrE